MVLKNPYGFIYITTNMVNGKRYIGQKKFDQSARWQSYLGGGSFLAKAIEKYGRENFKKHIIAIGYNAEQLNDLEREYITHFDAVNSEDYYNLIDGGSVISVLAKQHNMQCVCINNNYVFDSYIDAMIYSGYTRNRLKDTFKPKEQRKYKYKDNALLFRVYDKNTDDKKCVCCVICGQKIIKTSNRSKYCGECAKEKQLNQKKLWDKTNRTKKKKVRKP